MKKWQSVWWLKAVIAAAVVLMGTATPLRSAELDLSDLPVILARGVPPNFLLTLDDSESMGLGHILLNPSEKAYGINPRLLRLRSRDDVIALVDSMTPEEVLAILILAVSRAMLEDVTLTLADLDFATRSTYQNALAYKPGYTYKRPIGPSGDLFPNIDPEAAWEDGFAGWLWSQDPSGPKPATVNLKTSFRQEIFPEYVPPAAPAWYTEFHSNPGYDPATALPGACDNDVYTRSCYTYQLVGEENLQNFANWYSYHRTRLLTTKTAIAIAFSELNTSTRLGFQTINQLSPDSMVDGDGNVVGPDMSADLSDPGLHGVRTFSGDNRKEFYEWLAQTPVVTGAKTPLITGIVNAGEYFGTVEPYLERPGEDDTEANPNPAHSCRQNFQLLFTDGAWENDDPRVVLKDLSGNPLNFDATSPDLSWDTPAEQLAEEGANIFSGYDKFVAGSPYSDSNAGYVADHAFYYWVTDLVDDDVKWGTKESEWGRDNVPQRLLDKPAKNNEDLTAAELKEMFYNPSNDPAIWQHMVTFTIGFGVFGTLTAPDDLPALIAGTKSWPANRIDDLWHAAINSRGDFFNAKTPEQLANGMQTVVSYVATETGSAAALSANSGALFAQSLLFQASYDTVGWRGDVIALRLYTSDVEEGDRCYTNNKNDPSAGPMIGDVCAPPSQWQAGLKLDNLANPATDRHIITYQPGVGGVQFKWADLAGSYLSAEQIAYLNGGDGKGEERLNFLRGDDSNEQANGGTFRNRMSLLGDIVNSAPIFVGAPKSVFVDEDYLAFRESHKNRMQMVYVGSNDGMLHAFHSGIRVNAGKYELSDQGGKELFAYVPNAVFPNLNKLADASYSHKFYVDGPLNSGDVHNGDGWRTVLLGGLGKGGQAVFALDITNPSNFSQSNASSIVLWEFNDQVETDLGLSPDLGYSYGKPAIARVPSVGGNKWAAIFGNGFNNTETDGNASATGDAALYLVSLDRISSDNPFSLSNVVKLPIPVGMDEDPSGSHRANGLSSVTVVDTDADLVADIVYAGDLFGNVWKILLKDTGPEFAFGSKENPEPLFSARGPTGAAQPITSKIRVINHPRGRGLMLLFGTGKFLGATDMGDDSVQTFYGIWDDEGVRYGFAGDASAIGRDDLLAQTIVEEGVKPTVVQGETINIHYRVTSDNRIVWRDRDSSEGSVGWYLDLISPALDGGEQGERVFQEPQSRDDRIVFTSVIPSSNSDPCMPGKATGWVNIVDARDGSRLGVPPVDTNLNGTLETDDLVPLGDTDTTLSSIRISDEDIVYSVPSTIVSGSDLIDYLADSTGKHPVKLLESIGLAGRAWSEIR